MSLNQDSKCRGCGRRILWVVTSSGVRHPLDAVAPVFQLQRRKLANGDEFVEWARAPDAYVSHFVTCPKRDQFRKPTPKEART